MYNKMDRNNISQIGADVRNKIGDDGGHKLLRRLSAFYGGDYDVEIKVGNIPLSKDVVSLIQNMVILETQQAIISCVDVVKMNKDLDNETSD